MVKIIHSADEFNNEIKGEAIVDFNATWCGPCQMLKPIIEKIAEEHPELNILSLDVDEVPSPCEKLGVFSIPTVIIFKDGKEVKRNVGYLPEAGFKKFLGI